MLLVTFSTASDNIITLLSLIQYNLELRFISLKADVRTSKPFVFSGMISSIFRFPSDTQPHSYRSIETFNKLI